MPGSVILAVDQGTTNTKALLVDPGGSILARASRPMTLQHPRSGWAEQSAESIWTSVSEAITEVIAQADGRSIRAIAISNQRETVVVWDAETGQPIAPAISWQCRRSTERCLAMKAAGHEALLIDRTGLSIDPLFPAAKLAWILDECPGARARAEAGSLRAGTVDSWLVWKLTEGAQHATDHGNAARTQLFNIHDLQWDNELTGIFNIPLSMLPTIMSSDACFGTISAPELEAIAGIPIHAVMGDSHAALFAQGRTELGVAKVTIGTGSSIMSLSQAPIRSENGLSSTIAWSQAGKPRYALEGNITVSGQAAAFVTKLLGLPDELALSSLAQTVEDAAGVVFVPALAGLGAPHWKPEARGLISGMSNGTGPAHIARATLDAIAMQIVDVCRAMEADLATSLPMISVDGGATRNAFLLQLLADLLDCPVRRPGYAELSALGVARMAAGALGIFEDDTPGDDDETFFMPAMSAAERKRIQLAWADAVRRATFTN